MVRLNPDQTLSDWLLTESYAGTAIELDARIHRLEDHLNQPGLLSVEFCNAQEHGSIPRAQESCLLEAGVVVAGMTIGL